MKFFWVVFAVAVLVFLSGCTEQQPNQNEPTQTASIIEDTAMTEEGGNRFAVIETEKGVIKFELYEKRAPISTANFIKLAEKGFYDGLIFHRVEPGFVIQTGDPKGTGTGGSDERIPLEIHPELRHVLGAVGMARTNDPNSATNQFYITIGDASFLDDKYAVFGIVTEGIDVAKSIKKGDKMIKVTIE
ncbi:MAG: peptidylprolyl isomerase [Candidatus Altiarchaeota archaeon]